MGDLPRRRGAEDRVSAVAALRSASGRSRLAPDAEVTTANVAEYYASPETVELVAGLLVDLGFEVTGKGPLGVGFAGPRALFERVFGGGTGGKTDGGTGAKTDGGTEGKPGPAFSLPACLRPYVERVTLTGGVRLFQGDEPTGGDRSANDRLPTKE